MNARSKLETLVTGTTARRPSARIAAVLLGMGIGMASVVAAPTAAVAATGNGCSAYALVPSTSYSAGLTYQIWAHASSSCAYKVNYTLTLWRDVPLLSDIRLASNSGTTTYVNTTYNGTRVNCGEYATPRGAKYYTKLTISWNGHSLTSESDHYPAC
jgi:hypothetical protein